MKLLNQAVAGSLFSFMLFLGVNASAKEIVRDEGAKKIFDQLVLLKAQHPTQVTSYINSYFGDPERPQLGKLWVTTIYPSSQPKTFCFENDFRDVDFKEYLCEIYP